jgi:hypothetical protein
MCNFTLNWYEDYTIIAVACGAGRDRPFLPFSPSFNDGAESEAEDYQLAVAVFLAASLSN